MNKQEIKEEIFAGLVLGLVVGLVAGVLGLVYGLVAGLVYGLVTQSIAYFNNLSLFSPFDFWSCLIGLILVQAIGWIIVFRLNKENGK